MEHTKKGFWYPTDQNKAFILF